MLILKRTDSTDKDFIALVTLLDAHLRIRNGEQDAFFAQYNKIDSIKNVVVAYENDLAVGCGAFKEFTPGVAEIKRMYVRPEFRRKGVAQQILNALETWASELHYKTLILETGKDMTDAVTLYIKSHYSIMHNYGQYEQVESSVCMKKELSPIA